MWNNMEVTEENLIDEIESIGETLKHELDLPIGVMPLDAGGSKFFKTVYQNPARTHEQQFIDRES
jgi:hypothetical protein